MTRTLNHDELAAIRNLLAIVTGNAELLEMEAASFATVQHKAKTIRKAGFQISDLLKGEA